jgi:hypothetical protein
VQLTNALSANSFTVTTNTTPVLKWFPWSDGGVMMTNVGEGYGIHQDGLGLVESWAASEFRFNVPSYTYAFQSDGVLVVPNIEISDTGANSLSVSGGAAILGNGVFETNVVVRGALNSGQDAGASDAYSITPSPALTGYATGQQVWFKAATANTGAATLNVNALGAKTIVKLAGAISTTLADNDIRAGQWVHCVYDGTNFQMQSQTGNSVSAGVTGVTADSGGTTTGATVTIAGGTGIDSVRSGDTVTVSVDSTVALSAIYPNTTPTAGQMLVGNAGGTAYEPVSSTGSGAPVRATSPTMTTPTVSGDLTVDGDDSYFGLPNVTSEIFIKGTNTLASRLNLTTQDPTVGWTFERNGDASAQALRVGRLEHGNTALWISTNSYVKIGAASAAATALDVSGTVTDDAFILNQWNAGTIAGAGTLTLVNTTNRVGATFSGSTANITLPATPSHDILVVGTNSASATQIITLSSSLLWTGRGYSSATLTNSSASDGRFEILLRASGGAWVGVQAIGDAWAPTGTTTDTFVIAISDETTALTAGTAKVTFRAPYAFTVTGVRLSTTTAATGGTLLTVDINETGSGSILSTKLTTDASEKTSTTAATAAVISDSSIADDAEITIDIDTVGSTIAGAGAKVYITHTH